MNHSLYTPELWQKFTEKIGLTKSEFKLKKYPQLDPYFNFLDAKEKIHDLVSDPELKKIATHSFIPFVKILTKTPRYRWQENEKEYGLETKIRPIAFASHFDSYIYSFYSFALTLKYQEYIRERKFHDPILAYRNDLDGKCNIQFAKEVFDAIKNKSSEKGTCAVIALDITGYFDNIRHETLKEKWCKILKSKELPADQYKIFRSLTNYAYVNKDSILRHFKVDLKRMRKEGIKWQTLLDLIPDNIEGPSFKEKFSLLKKRKLINKNLPIIENGTTKYKGIPQGSPISALLSNIYLIDFDEWLYNLSKKENLDFTYKRYCDDLIVVCDSEKINLINNAILEEIKKYGLKIKKEKTELIEFCQNSKGKIRAFDKKALLEDQVTLNKNNESKYYKNLQYLGFEFNGQNSYIRPGSLSRYFLKMRRRIIKTIVMAYSDKSKINKIKRRQIYLRYSHFGPRNFITYANNSSKDFYKNSDGVNKPGMNSRSIKNQIASHVKIIEREISKKSNLRYDYKEYVRLKKKESGKRKKFIPFKE